MSRNEKSRVGGQPFYVEELGKGDPVEVDVGRGSFKSDRVSTVDYDPRCCGGDPCFYVERWSGHWHFSKVGQTWRHLTRRKPVIGLRRWLWYKLLRFALRRAGPTSTFSCANRYETTHAFGPLEVRVVTRDTREPDGYCREELLQMLRLVRSEEARQGWKVPEPRPEDVS
jgi:hypothetical protein